MGGWVVPNAYFCLQDGWVGYSKCLRKQNIKIFRKKIKAQAQKVESKAILITKRVCTHRDPFQINS